MPPAPYAVAPHGHRVFFNSPRPLVPAGIAAEQARVADHNTLPTGRPETTAAYSSATSPRVAAHEPFQDGDLRRECGRPVQHGSPNQVGERLGVVGIEEVGHPERRLLLQQFQGSAVPAQ